MGKLTLAPEVLAIIAGRFRALGEPARLQILQSLRAGERTVGELAEDVDMSQANVSKHLQLLHNMGFVTRRKDGLFVLYAIANNDVFRLCDLMCGRLESEVRERRRLLAR